MAFTSPDEARDPTPFLPSKQGVPVLRLDEVGQRVAAERVELGLRGIRDDALDSGCVVRSKHRRMVGKDRGRRG